MNAESTKALGTPNTQANGKKTSTPGKERASNSASNAKPSSSRSAKQGEKKTINISKS